MRRQLGLLWKWFVAQAGYVAATVAFVECLVLAWQNYVAAASVCAAVSVGALIFHHLPIIESFKIFAVEAKLRARLGEAEEILGSLRRLASVLAEQAFTELGWSGKWDGMTVPVRRRVARKLNGLLAELGVPEEAINEARRDYIRFIALDMFFHFDEVMSIEIKKAARERGAARKALDPSEYDEAAERKKFDEMMAIRESFIRETEKSPDEVGYTDGILELGAFCQAQIPADLPTGVKETLSRFASELGTMFAACRVEGNLTDKAQQYLERYGADGSRAKHDELFGQAARN